jgi:ATP-dependent exoDNAse (exonuclease V) beta subunit
VRTAIPEADAAAVAAPARAAVSPLAALERAERAAEVARTSARPLLARPSGLSEADEEHAGASADADEPLPPPAAAARELARALGTALHEVLERWTFKNASSARALLRSAVTRVARLASVSEDVLAAQAGPALDALLASGLPGALAKVEVVGRELPLLFEDRDGTRWNGTIDLLYRDPADGRLVVADYKSDAAPERADRERYGRQLAVYARGVARLFPGELAPAAELIWLRTGQRERLPLESTA